MLRGGEGQPFSGCLSLQLRSVEIGLADRTILTALDLDLRPGATALVGCNGAGKTTTIRTLCGLLRPRSGQVLFRGMDIHTSAPTLKSYRRALGWLPQEVALPPGMTVREFVRYAAWLREVPRPRIRDAVAEALASTALVQLADRRMSVLSGGQRRRAQLAAALVGDPEVLLLDEPTVGLDPVQREQLLSVIRAIGKQRVVVVSTHLLEDVAATATRVCVLEEGVITRAGPLSDFVDDPADPSVRQLRSSLFPGVQRSEHS